MRAIDKFRCEILNQISELKSFKNSWPVYSQKLEQIVGSVPTSQQIFSIGENLSEIFTSNSTDSTRDQSDVSTGGAAWECLCTWYMNLIFWGTDIIATRQNKRFVPQSIYDAFSVTIANHKTNTESDIVIFSVPNVGYIENLNLNTINELISSDPSSVDTAIVQCKTNWNDNSQIPMLWDLIYNSTSFRIPNVYVGTNGLQPSSFHRFTYSFLTVPSNKRTIYKPKSTPVLRVANLTGGNYWGKPTQQGVSNSLSNFFGRNFGTHFIGGVPNHIQNNITQDQKFYTRFKSLQFKDN